MVTRNLWQSTPNTEVVRQTLRSFPWKDCLTTGFVIFPWGLLIMATAKQTVLMCCSDDKAVSSIGSRNSGVHLAFVSPATLICTWKPLLFHPECSCSNWDDAFVVTRGFVCKVLSELQEKVRRIWHSGSNANNGTLFGSARLVLCSYQTFPFFLSVFVTFNSKRISFYFQCWS